MEFNKTNNLLGDPIDKVPRYVTKKWIEINPQSTKDFKTSKEIKFKTSMLRSDLSDYSEAYVWVKGNVVANNENNNNNFSARFAYKNNAPFVSCVSKISGKLVENAKDLDVVMPMYNLLEYRKNYEKTSGSLFNYFRDELNSINTAGANPINISIRNSKSFDYKSHLNNILNRLNNDNIINNVEIAVPLKHLGNFWRNLNVSLINCEISLDLSWSDKCVLVGRAYRAAQNPVNPAIPAIESPTNVTFTITKCKPYVPVVTLSAENENRLFEILKSGFKGTVKWNKYMSYISNQAKNNNLNYLIDPTFEKVNRLFVLPFENEDDRRSYYKYYVLNVEIKNYNVHIDGNRFFELPVKNIEETYEKIMQISDDNDYFTRGMEICLIIITLRSTTK